MFPNQKNYNRKICQIVAFSFTFPVHLSVRLIEWMSWWKKRKEALSEWIGYLHSAVGSKSDFPSNQINFFFLEAIVARHIQKDSFYRHFYFCLIIFFITETPSLAAWVFSSSPFWYAAVSTQQQWKEKTNRNIYFLFLTWGDRGIHLNNLFHWDDSSKVNMNI